MPNLYQIVKNPDSLARLKSNPAALLSASSTDLNQVVSKEHTKGLNTGRTVEFVINGSSLSASTALSNSDSFDSDPSKKSLSALTNHNIWGTPVSDLSPLDSLPGLKTICK